MSEIRASLRKALATALDRTDELRGHLFSDRLNVLEDAVLNVIVDGILSNNEPLTEGDFKSIAEFDQIVERIKLRHRRSQALNELASLDSDIWPEAGR